MKDLNIKFLIKIGFTCFMFSDKLSLWKTGILEEAEGRPNEFERESKVI